jgi:hypothetical protein
MSIYVDLDGTLAHYDQWRGMEHIGEPVPAMLTRVREWLGRGKTVKVFTARMSAESYRDRMAFLFAFQAWCDKHELPRLEVTATKGFDGEEFWDDRAIRVEANTGRRIR